MKNERFTTVVKEMQSLILFMITIRTNTREEVPYTGLQAGSSK